MNTKGAYVNIEEVISRVKRRPGMYVREIKLDSVYNFLEGFLYNNITTARASEVDFYYKENFYKWVFNWTIKKYYLREVKYEINWTSFILNISKNEEEALALFFKICEEFFENFYVNKKAKDSQEACSVEKKKI